ncbi:MAG: ATP-dependent helicase [Treponema sp.]|jgi:DNA helicase-2/ATP-dependent DNA helicase PcrA|nr:ATP-dependent helicase [Treponema sp.]
MADHIKVPEYLDKLNDEQRKAVLHAGCPLLILAGAGSGKTRVITTKIAYLIRECGYDPRSILAVTFTNKAAREMAHRAAQIEPRASDAVLRTFHSFGAWFLRRNGHLLGLPSGFVIYDDDDMTALLATIMTDSTKQEIKSRAHLIARAKDYFLSPSDPETDLIDHRGDFRKIYQRYEERLAQIGNVDFGDLIKKPVEILKQFPEVAERFRARFKVILVDEYQDSNIAQFELLKELCGSDTYLCAVGDDDQSIYRFRGAEVRNILQFPELFPGTEIIRLEENYRSVLPILNAASSVVSKNKGRLGKTLRASRQGGELPVLAFFPNDRIDEYGRHFYHDDESEYCAKLIENSMKSEGRCENFSDWAILYRTNAQSLSFETELLRRQIPYKVVGSLKFYEREEIKDTLALLSFLVNPKDEIAFRRVVNKPTRGVGAATVDRIIIEASVGFSAKADDLLLSDEPTASADIAEAARRLMPALSAKARKGIEVFLNAIEIGRTALSQNDESFLPEKKKTKQQDKNDDLRFGEGLSRCVVALVEESGIAEYHRSNDDINGAQRIANLQELANAASEYESSIDGLLQFLEHLELDRSMAESGDNDDTVTLITLHNTKGLEFRRVIMTGLEQGIFPRDDKQNEDLEEERRLFYVGATRAMDELFITSCGQRRLYGRTQPMEPSSFLREMDKDCIRVIGDAPYGFRSSSSGSGNHRDNTSSSAAQNPAKPKVSSDGRWKVGDSLFHDDYGYGGVIDIRESEDGSIVYVRFNGGMEKQFLSEFQSSRYMKTDYSN